MKLFVPIVVICALALLVSPSAARAGDGFSLKGNGRIESVDASRERFVVRLTRVPRSLTLAWNKDTQFQRGKEPATAASLEPGQNIEIRYQISSSGRHHATRIVILPAPGGAEETAPKL